MAGGAWGALFQIEVLWNPLEDGVVVWLNFAPKGGFRRENDLFKMEYSNLKV